MKRFAELFQQLDQTTKTNEKVDALAAYFTQATPADAAHAIYFLTGRKLKRLVQSGLLRKWAAQEANIPDWLLDECYHAVGDLAETIALVIPDGSGADELSLAELGDRWLPMLARGSVEQQRDWITTLWRQTDRATRLVAMKLITGSFRVGVSDKLVARGIARHAQLPVDVIAHRLMGNWKPTESFLERLIDPNTIDTRLSQPYPFCLAHAIELETDDQDRSADELRRKLGPVDDFAAEWKWDGIRGQVIRRGGQTFLWSRGEELMENRWPEIEAASLFLPDGTVLDGEILASRGRDQVLPFAELQRRIGRKSIGRKLLDEVPVVFQAFDLLESGGVDLRGQPFVDRRRQLERLLGEIDHPHLSVTELIAVGQWSDLAELRRSSRQRNAEGLMLKRHEAPYSTGRVRGTWWKWKIAPHTVDAVLIYAQQGHGKRAGLFTDYTFAVWSEGQLVPFAKAYSGLNDAEIRAVDRFVRTHTNDRFGPVRSVTPELVMELAFEGLQRSTRHKSGIATRFPRIVRWRQDKRPEDADHLADLIAMLE